MKHNPWRTRLVIGCLVALGASGNGAAADAPLPAGVKAVWDLAKAHRDRTPTRERVCLNGLWRWQPARDATDAIPTGSWGYFKVPGFWPGTSHYAQEDCQTLHAHPDWKDASVRGISAAWYQREFTVPEGWTGRRITLAAEYLHSLAIVYVDGKKAGELRFPAGEVDLTPLCLPGGKHVLSLHVLALPLKGVMLSYNDTNSAREVKGTVERRGLCGDVFLTSTPTAARIIDVKIDTSVRNGELTLSAALEGLAADGQYALRVQIAEAGRSESEPAADILTSNIIKYVSAWKPSPVRRALYAGDPAGKRHREAAGLSVSDYTKEQLLADRLLIVGPGGGRQLTGDAAVIGKWLQASGHLLANWAMLDGADEKTMDGRTVERISALMAEKAKEGKPFFLAAGFRKPHLPWAVPRKYFNLYPAGSIVPPKDPPLRAVPAIALLTELSPAPPPASRAEAIAAYYAAISFMDAQVGLLLAQLDRLKLWDNTIVVLIGDNGFHLGDHDGLWSKLTNFEQAARVPCIVVAPGCARGKSCPRTVELLDLYPTLAELCGLARPAGLEGSSLVPLLKRPDAAWDRPARTIAHHREVCGKSVRTERWRYTEWADGKEGVELYDHETDPNECTNLAGEPAHAKTIQELRRLLRP